jgi:hypothetical protein
MWTEAKPNFFDGTVIESAITKAGLGS